MTEQELRRALAICEKATRGPVTLRLSEKEGDEVVSGAFLKELFTEDFDDYMGLNDDNAAAIQAAYDPSTGYAATLRALLEARELLQKMHDRFLWTAPRPSDCQCADCDLDRKVRAFLAEGESK